MSGLTFAWDTPDDDDEEESRLSPAGIAAWLAGLAFLPLLAWLLLILAGGRATLGWAEGSERHGASGIAFADDGGLGLGTMFLFEGQRARWDYDVEVEGRGGVILRIAKLPPSPDFVARSHFVRASGSGRFEVVAPESAFYSFEHELIPHGALLGPVRPGKTRYRLRWGVN